MGVLEAVQRNGYALEYASDELRGDVDVVIEAALASGGEALSDATAQLLHCKAFWTTLLRWFPVPLSRALVHLPKELHDDRHLLYQAVKKDWRALSFASDDLREDRSLVREAMCQKWEVLGFTSPELQRDRELLDQRMICHQDKVSVAEETTIGINKCDLVNVEKDNKKHCGNIMSQVKAALLPPVFMCAEYVHGSTRYIKKTTRINMAFGGGGC